MSVQSTHGAFTPTIYDNSDSHPRNWNSVAAAFMPSSGSGTQPTGIHITRILHFVGELVNPVSVPFPSGGNAIVISTSNPSVGGWDMSNLADNEGHTYTRTPFTNAPLDPQIFSTCLGTGAGDQNLVISWTPDTINNHVLFYDIAGAATTGGSTGCVGATVNTDIGYQPPTINAPMTGDPVITPTTVGSVIIATSYFGIGPPSASLTPGVVFNSIWATGMIDSSSWDTGDPYGYVYTNAIAPISFNWQMANSTGLSNGGTNFDGAAIEILPGASTSTTLTSIAVAPSGPTIATGATQQFTATGTYSDGSTQDITTQASWTSSSPTTATITSAGLATALCSGNSTIAAALSNLSGQSALTVTGLDATTTVVSSSANPAPAGQTVTFTATVTSSCGTPSGSVQFVVDGANYTTPVALSASGVATASASLASGTHTISAIYSGSSSFSTSTSNSFSQTVGAIATTTTLSVSPAGPLPAGSSYTLTATVAAASGTTVPTGNVGFTIGGSTFTVALDAAGIAIWTGTAPTTPQALAVSAAYQGTAQFSASTSSTLNETVVVVPTTTTLSITPGGGSLAAGSTYTLSATVTPVIGTVAPSGNVVFTIGSATQTAALNTSGVATWTGTAPTTAQTLTFTAAYQGTTQFSASTSTPLTEIVAAISTNTVISVSANQITQGASDTLTATVTPATGTTSPTGTVSFYSGTLLLGTSTLNQGIATLATTALPAGIDPLTAAYGGAGAFAGSTSAPVSVTVTNALTNSATTLTASAIQTTTGVPVTFTATVAGVSGTAVPGGSVSFYSGSTLLGSSPLSAGVASFTTASLPAGSDVVVAAYAGDSAFNQSVSNTVTISVSAPVVATGTVLAITPAGGSLVAGSPYTLTATVTPASGTAVPTGNVIFTIGSITQIVPLNSAGVAVYSAFAPSVAGALTISASYPGATGFSASTSNTLNEAINVIATTAAISISPSSFLTVGSPYTVTAIVTPVSGIVVPSGNVVFTIGSATQTLPLNASGIAVYSSTAPISTGTLAMSATYQGSGEFSPSNANTITATILPASTVTTLTTSQTQINAGASVTLTSVVTSTTGLAVSGGTVNFFSGSTLLGAVPLTAGVASLSLTTLPPGPDPVSASYTGSSGFASSTSSTITITVIIPSNPVPGITSLSPLLTLVGKPAFTLTVVGSEFTSASTIYWGPTPLTTQFASTTQLSAPIPASAVAYAGITSVIVQTPAPGGGGSNAFQFEVDSAGPDVTPPVFSPSTATVSRGSTATYAVTLPVGATNVTVQCLNLPAGATCTYTASSGTLTIATTSSTPAGTWPITAVFTETLPVSASALAGLLLLLLPRSAQRQRRSSPIVWLNGVLALLLLLGVAISTSACGSSAGGTSTTVGSSQSHQVTSSSVVTLVVQ